MAVMRNSIIFGGVDSADFGIYIGGEGTFDAPKRDVEMISIPGRNGAFALDKGRFENIEVTYSAFNFEPDMDTFSAQLEAFRNAICSQKGYQRLTDTFHPDEYRMAAYIDGLEIKPIEYNTAATFDITFDCKPQRYLLSGEEAVDVTSGDTITNPTLFEASPMLEVEGYGTININDEVVSIQNEELGSIKICDSSLSASVTLDTTQLNTGDVIYADDRQRVEVTVSTENMTHTLDIQRRGNVTNGSCNFARISQRVTKVSISPNFGDAYNGTSKTVTTTVPLRVSVSGYSTDCSIEVTTTYTASTNRVSLSVSWTSKPSTVKSSNVYRHNYYRAYSTKSILPSPMHIDLDIGEAYGVIGGEPLSFDNLVTLPAELPKLKSGANTITADNTVTDLKVVPRYWRI